MNNIPQNLPINDITTQTAQTAPQTATAAETAGAASLGLWEKVKANFQPEIWVKKLDLSWDNVLVYIEYFLGGFAAGFILKRYLISILIITIGVIVILYGLQYLGITTINWNHAYTYLGLPQNTTLSSLIWKIITWLKNHIMVSIFCFLGFIIGYKIG